MVTVPDPAPFGLLLFPAVPLGPIWLLYHCVFRRFDLHWHKLYHDTGVECIGITTHRHQIIRRTNFIETGREYRIRYLYQPPGESAIYHIDFVNVSKRQFAQQRFIVLVLPGRPDSGIPKSNVIPESQRCDKYFIAAMNVLSLVWTAFLLYLFGTVDCTDDYQNNKTLCTGEYCDTCEIVWTSVIPALVFVLLIGLVGSALHYCKKRKQIMPGSVSTLERLHQTSVPAGNASRASLNENVPMAEVVSIDEGELHLSIENDEEEATATAAVAGVQPIVLAAEPIDEHNNESTNDESDETPRAKVLELV